MYLMLTASRNDLTAVDKLFPTNGFTADQSRIYFMITEKQYKRAKDLLPKHVIFKLPKRPNNEQKKLKSMP